MLSDLKPARTSGLEFLRAVRRGYPSIRVIAMGAAFSGDGVPPGIPADAFYERGAGSVRLIEAVDALTRPDRPNSRLSMESLFGFKVFEAIPASTGAERSAFPAEREIVFPVPWREHPGEA